ncbi:hypothetical protein ADIS_0818 [Lunatimonas lonarensis]|uniref:Peptidase M48 domain-containing protein n=1 Tax=Lunatimonas lonarensis TaxID=1232681 RepID=R7ZXE1_9BACT|nr:M48 family metallopeptidase [Lunatimonas lonarensis]EON78644.1 hypothetical protein ADIS_0818 [Lunatimonas lonarensis]
MKKKEIQLSKEFKKQATKAIISIAFFVVTYLLILLVTIGLTALCITGGVLLIALKPMLFTIALGIGLASLGILILIFLLKFVFQNSKTDRSDLMEITQDKEPRLFAMIHEIVVEVGTGFPKKVYLSSDVNASVFYDSSFWSMFLPVKKNLQIGLGLVNTVTKEELKSILAHEFGHFSQRTMKVGSYVYNVNQVIYNMLFDNDAYEKIIQKWAEVSGYFSLFVSIAVKIIMGIQWVLRKLYELVNKNYLGLSREMEFHADEIAASVTGYLPLKRSLLRMNLADSSFDNVLNFYNRKISENIKSENLYDDQSALVQFLSEVNNLKITDNLPDISLEEQIRFDKSKLVIKDQWASHPSIAERIKRLEQTGYRKETHTDSLANSVFSDIIRIQKQFTNVLFETATYQGEAYPITSEKFMEEYRQETLKNSFSKMYNGYYDNKNPVHVELTPSQSYTDELNISELFSDDKIDLVYTSIALQNDTETLENIANNSISIKTFDYDGIKYRRKEAKNLIKQLSIELENINEKIKGNDINIYQFFQRMENKQNSSNELKKLYTEFFDFDGEFEAKISIFITLQNELQFINVTTPTEQINSNFKRIKPIEETLKNEINKLLVDNMLTSEITPEIRENLEKYTSASWDYFGVTIYKEENIALLFTALDNYAYLLSRKYFLLKKAVLDYQERLMENQTQSSSTLVT